MRALIIIIAASVAFPLFADTPRAVQLVGHWRYTNSSAKRIDDITFAADGTYTGRVTQDGKLLGEFAGKWAVEGSTLSYHYTRSSYRRFPSD